MFSEGKATKENISVFWFIWPLMKDFPLLSHTSTCDFLATLWYTWCLKEVPFGRSLPDYETVHHEIMNRRWVDPRTWMVIEDWRKNEWNKKESILYSKIWKKIHEEDLKQTRRDRPVCKKKLGNYNKCEFSNFFLFQWPKMIISVLVTWMTVDCNLAVRVVLSF